MTQWSNGNLRSNGAWRTNKVRMGYGSRPWKSNGSRQISDSRQPMEENGKKEKESLALYVHF
jgi:hypothetical protein